MFARRIAVNYKDKDGTVRACPIAWIDNFAMRNFTNNSIFDDTLPIADGWMEAGFRVPLDPLQSAMTDWFRRKGYLGPDETLLVTVTDRPGSSSSVDEAHH